MLVQNQLVQTTWNSTTKKYYEKLGYKYTSMFDTFEVRVEDLPKGSHSKIEVVCDFCGKHYEKTYKDYWSQHDGGDCCADCQGKKSLQTFNERHGLEKRIQYLKDGTKKHGVTNIMELQEFRDKVRNTNIEKYGLPCVLSDPFIHNTDLSWTETARKKRSDTCMNKYGVDCVLKSKEVREKIIVSYYKNGSIKTSSQQKAIYDMLKQEYDVCELNYPCGKYSLDCMIQINNQNIDIEYDGMYWHENKALDSTRDSFIISQGYKVLRIQGSRAVPTLDQLQTEIINLLRSNDNISYITVQ